MDRRRWIASGRLALGVVISFVFLYFAMRHIQWVDLWRLFRKASCLYVIPAFLLLMLINWIRAYRWRVLMYPDRQLSLPRLFRYVNIGYFFNNVLPAKAGEVVRGYLTGRVLAGGIGHAVSTLLIERLLDVLTLVVFLIVLLPFIDLPNWAARGGLVLGVAAIGGTVVLLVLHRFGQKGVDWVWRIVGRLPVVGHPRLRSVLLNLVEGFGVLATGKLLPGIVISSLLIWCGYGSLNYLFLAVFRMTDLSFSAAALVLVATGLSMVVPSSPGAMGVFEWAAVQALAVYGVQQSVAFGYALGLHTFTNVALIVVGLVGLMREGLSYTSIREAVGQAAVERSGGDSASTRGASGKQGGTPHEGA